LIASQVGISGVVVIEDFVQIWGQAGIAKDLTIGKGAVVLPKSGVMRSLAGGKAYLGAPAEEVKAAMRQWIAIRKLPQIIRKLKI
jgi:UDP-3-O-[3-hydroxymyristoyl] glucosamine N-acyltransferase